MDDQEYGDIGAEEEDNHEEAYDYGKENVVFLIDAGGDMNAEIIVLEGGPPTSSLQLALRTVADFMRKKIEQGSQDEFALVFYNTAKKQNDLGQDGVYVMMDMRQPNANDIKRVMELDGPAFQQQVGTYQRAPAGGAPDSVTPATSLKYGLWVAQTCLNKRIKAGRALARLIIFSNEQDPSGGRAETKQQILARADNLRETLRASARFFPIAAAVRPFSTAPFWAALLNILRDEDEAEEGQDRSSLNVLASGSANGNGGGAGQVVFGAAEVQDRLQALAADMKRRMTKRRPTSTLRFKITPELEIAVQSFILVREAPKPKMVTLHAQTNQEVRVHSALVSADNADILQRVDARAFAVSNAPADRHPKVVFSTEELGAVKAVCGSGIAVLGFKPRSCLQDFHNVGHSLFLRPAEKVVKGSTAAFTALHRALLKTDRIAIARYRRHKNTLPSLVALLAQEEVMDQGEQIEPEGIHMIPLPWANDVRSPETEEAAVGKGKVVPAEPAQVDAAKALITVLHTEDWGTGCLHNPSLVRHFEVLQALALGEEPPRQLQQDSTEPGSEQVKAQAKPEVAAFKALVQVPVPGFAEGSPAKKGGTKRKADAEGGPDLSISEQYAAIDWQANIANGKIKMMTIPMLKVYCLYHKLKQTGNKGELVERIMQHAQSR